MKHLILAAVMFLIATPAHGQEARRRWEMQRQIRLDKFEQVLPRAEARWPKRPITSE